MATAGTAHPQPVSASEDLANWSEKAEALADGDDRAGAIKFLEGVVERLRISNGPSSTSGLAIGAAMRDLAALYEEEGFSMKADELRAAAITAGRSHQELGTSDGSCCQSQNPSVQEDASTSCRTKGQNLQECTSARTSDLGQEEWENENHIQLSSPCTTASRTSNVPVQSQEKTIKQRGRGAFTYGANGLYSDTRSARIDETHASVIDGDRDMIESRNDSEALSDTKDDHFIAKHVLVISGFPPKTTLKELEMLVEPFASQSVAIRRINDTCSLAVFRNPVLARKALSTIQSPKYKVQSFAESVEYHALISEKDLEPPLPRPTSSSHAAHRMIVGALHQQGLLKQLPSKTKLTAQELRKQQEERKQRLMTREKLRQEAWGEDD